MKIGANYASRLWQCMSPHLARVERTKRRHYASDRITGRDIGSPVFGRTAAASIMVFEFGNCALASASVAARPLVLMPAWCAPITRIDQNHRS
jgi:hypothetical protein